MTDTNTTDATTGAAGEGAAPADADYFRSGRLIRDPYPYWDALRAECPVHQEPHEGVYMVTGYDEALAVYHDPGTFSSVNSVIGPFGKFPVPLEGDDLTELIEEHRGALPFTDQLPSFDPPRHTEHRSLLMRLFTPRRLQENEEAMGRISNELIDGFAASGACEFVGDFASPMAMLVIADLLGVPEEDRGRFRDQLAAPSTSGKAGVDHSPLEFLYETFRTYIEDRRANPRDDVLTRIAQATFSDGSTPTVTDVMLLASNLFAAGQETTVRLLTYSLQKLAEDPELQARLRAEPDAIPNFIEEALRFESPIKGDFRLAKRTTEVGGVTIPAGSTVMVINGAANRDETKFECPNEFRPDRPDAREHMAFGHGVHFCIGAALARAEGRITVECMLDRLDDIRISEEHHGPAGDRRYRYVPTYMLRGLSQLHLEFAPAGS
ncbi:cytochrome P450 [Dermatobacter hominis]|uniref:cytochrome P450 n=1 Tax=Dermatobacter hominis TaxID=2884263 RepID=UPI001D0FEF31|nr:cytochrome P450 [Dermatobacter hominis]UDY36717.1 cytochrome P450 [Dermatobacter hominis]